MTIELAETWWRLKQLQSLSLEAKIERSKRKIKEAYTHFNGDCYVSLSGRDSAVLLDLVRDLYPKTPAVFCDTGLEYPEVREYIKGVPNIKILRAGMTFKAVIDKYGYPVVSKEISHIIWGIRNTKSAKLKRHRFLGAGNSRKSGKISDKWLFLLKAPFKISSQCCDIMKKRPAAKYEKETGQRPFIGTLAEDSARRYQRFIRYGCNAFGLNHPSSAPLSIWTHADILEYVRRTNLRIPSCYPSVDHTGCMYCAFGAHMEPEPNRFQRMAITHPIQYRYCMENLNLKEVLEYVKIPWKPIGEGIRHFL